MGIKRDSVNRVRKLIRLPITVGSLIAKGAVITLVNVKECNIFPNNMADPPVVKDPMARFNQPDGDGYGDAIFDPNIWTPGDPIFDPNTEDTP